MSLTLTSVIHIHVFAIKHLPSWRHHSCHAGGPNMMLRPISTPLSNKISGNLPYSSVAPDQDDEFRLQLATETAGLFLGPMPCNTFLNRYLPLTPSTGGLSDAQGKFNRMSLRMLEAQMYKPFISISLYLHHLCNRYCQRSMQLNSLHPI